MYALSFSSRTFFCCEPGQYGVLPISGYTGICEPVDQPVASSLVATPASQAGATGVTTAVVQAPSTGTVTSTMRNGALTTILTTALVTATGTGNGSPASTSGATGSGFGQSGTVTFHISKGGLIGIVLVAVVALASIIIFCVYWRKRKADRRRGGAVLGGNGGGGAVYAVSGTPMRAAVPRVDDKNPGVMYAQPVGGSPVIQQRYPQQDYGKSELPSPVMHANTHAGMSPNMEVPPSRRWEDPYGRVEMP
jgi:hypothetical protein